MAQVMAQDQHKSFEELALPQLDAVYQVARRLTRNDHEAEDLVQETYFKAYRAFDRFEMRSFGIRPWLLKILNNTFFNKRARDKRGPLATDQQTLEETITDPGSTLPPHLDYEHLDQEVAQALDELSAEYRAVMLLWATNEWSYREIADMLEIPVGTVMSRLHRARQQLAKRLDEYARNERIGQVDDN